MSAGLASVKQNASPDRVERVPSHTVAPRQWASTAETMALNAAVGRYVNDVPLSRMLVVRPPLFSSLRWVGMGEVGLGEWRGGATQ